MTTAVDALLCSCNHPMFRHTAVDGCTVPDCICTLPPEPEPQTERTSVEVCAIAHCTYRNLDYWLRTGRLVGEDTARGSGSQRKLTLEQLEQVSYATGLLRAGFTTDAALRLAAELVQGRSVDVTVAEIVTVRVAINVAGGA